MGRLRREDIARLFDVPLELLETDVPRKMPATVRYVGGPRDGVTTTWGEPPPYVIVMPIVPDIMTICIVDEPDAFMLPETVQYYRMRQDNHGVWIYVHEDVHQELLSGYINRLDRFATGVRAMLIAQAVVYRQTREYLARNILTNMNAGWLAEADMRGSAEYPWDAINTEGCGRIYGKQRESDDIARRITEVVDDEDGH